jgi:hypothetical protein
MLYTKSPNSVKKAVRKIAVTEKRLAANRANAQKSTGPRTPEGKARSAQNAIKHGFAGSTFSVIRLEGLHEIDDLKADAVAFYRPANSQEMLAVERIALAQMQMLRAMRMESGLFTTALDSAIDPKGRPINPLSLEMFDGDLPVTRTQNRNFALGEGLRRMAREGNAWSLLMRYQAQAERQYRRAVEELERLRALPPQDFPIEPICPTQPEQNEELATLEELNRFAPSDFLYHPESSRAERAESPSPDMPPPPPLAPPASLAP